MIRCVGQAVGLGQSVACSVQSGVWSARSVGLLSQLYVLSSQVYGQPVCGQSDVCSIQPGVGSFRSLVSQLQVLLEQVCVVSQLVCCQLSMRAGLGMPIVCADGCHFRYPNLPELRSWIHHTSQAWVATSENF